MDALYPAPCLSPIGALALTAPLRRVSKAKAADDHIQIIVRGNCQCRIGQSNLAVNELASRTIASAKYIFALAAFGKVV